MDTEHVDVCTLCGKALQAEESDVVCTVHERGLKTFIAKSRDREDNKWQLWIGKTSVTVHVVVYYKTLNIGQSCNEWLCGNKDLSNIDKKVLLHVAAEIVRTDIEKASFQIERHPPASKFLDNLASNIPESLNFFISNLLKNDQEKTDENITKHCAKRYSIAYSIISMLRPKSFISNLQLAVGTYIYRKTGSKLTIDLLSKLGVSASYYNIQLYEASAKINPPETDLKNLFTQHMFDNTDHNPSTLHD